MKAKKLRRILRVSDKNFLKKDYKSGLWEVSVNKDTKEEVKRPTEKSNLYMAYRILKRHYKRSK
jgi:hypothetical protein